MTSLQSLLTHCPTPSNVFTRYYILSHYTKRSHMLHAFLIRRKPVQGGQIRALAREIAKSSWELHWGFSIVFLTFLHFSLGKFLTDLHTKQYQCVAQGQTSTDRNNTIKALCLNRERSAWLTLLLWMTVIAFCQFRKFLSKDCGYAKLIVASLFYIQLIN
jgi:hypothetical protein